MKYILAAVLSLALMPIMAMAQDFTKGLAAYNADDYPQVCSQRLTVERLSEPGAAWT